MSDLDKLVEAYFREKEQNDPITTLMEYIKEVHQELLVEEKEASIKSSKAKNFVLSLPKMVPTEAWGDPNNATRQEMDKFFRAIGGGASVEGKIKYLQGLQKVDSRIRSPRRIISTLILLESLSAVMNSFSASSAGFVFEGFLAGLLGGKQVADPEQGSLPIEDIVAFTEFKKSTNMPMSLKVLAGGESERKSAIKGSYTNLIDALTKSPAMRYIVVYKEGGGSVDKIQIKQFDLTTENFLDLMSASKNNKKLLQLPKRNVNSSYNFLSRLNSWEEMLPYLQRTKGYGRTPTVDIPGEERNIEPAQQLDEGKEGTQWYTNVPQLEKLGAQTNFQDLGSLEISPAALEKTAEQYMNILQGTISDLFQSVSDLSKNINSYFIEKKRSSAIQKGNEAIKNADEIENALIQVTKQETGAEA
jgi:hypothetical protein